MRLKGLGLGVGFVLLSAVALVAQYAPYYVLDGYGGVHAGGGAPAISPVTPYFGWDIARDVVYIPVATSDTNHGAGLLVLDGFGGIHKGGKLSTVSIAATPYFGWDIAKAIDFRRIDPQAYGAAPGNYVDITSSSYVQVIAESMNIVLPDAGYVIITLSGAAINPDASDTGSGMWVAGEIGIGVNSTTEIDSYSQRVVVLEDKSWGGWLPNHGVSITRTFYFSSSGTQRFYFLAKRYGGTGRLRVYRPTISCLYVNKRWDTYSQSSLASSLPPDLALAPKSEAIYDSGIVKK